MTNILELLKNEKVEWKKLGEVGEIKMCKRILKSQTSENGEIPFYKIGTFGKQPDSFISKELFLQYKEKYSYPKLGEILLSASGTIGRTVIFNGEDAYFQDSNIVWLSHDENKILNKYLYYFYHNVEWNPANGGTIKRLYNYNLANIEIPVPSLETQEKIVEILDKFTNYVTELQSELQSRTKQYTYYRDKLLSEEYLTKVTKEMEEDRRLNIVQLEEVVTIKNGKDWKKLGQGNIPVYGSGGEMGVFVDKYSYDKPTILIPRKGSIDNVFYLDKPFWNIDTIFHTEIDESKLIPKYFYYFIEHYDLNKLSDNSTRPSLTQSSLNKLKVPLPPLSLQNKIVKVLDKFQVLLADTKGLLPAEIEERQKQYEYYREKLLTFDIECSSTHARTSIISNNYYNILQEVANIVEVSIDDRVEWEKVSNFCKRQKGISITAKEMRELATDDGIVKVFAGGNTVAYLDVEIVGKDNIIDKPSIIVKSRGNIDFEYYDGMFSHKNEMWSYSINTENNIKYLYYYLKNNIEYFRSRAISGKLPQIATGITDNYKISLPPLHVQQHVVSILDKFDTLVNDIKEGLPKEIEQRQQQYEYWRECLLNFPR